MLTIPYLLAWNPDCKDKASELLEKTAIVATAPHEVDAAVVPYLDQVQGTPKSPGILSLLQEQLQREQEHGFELRSIPRFTISNSRNGVTGTDDAESEVSKKHPFPSLAIPEPVPAGFEPISPEVWYSLYADQEVEVRSLLMPICLVASNDCRLYLQLQTLHPPCFEMSWSIP